MPKPGPIDLSAVLAAITTDLALLSAAITALQQDVTALQAAQATDALILENLQTRVVILEDLTPPPTIPITPDPGELTTVSDSAAFTAALAQFRALMIDNTVNDATGNGSYGGGCWAQQILAGENTAATGGLVYYDGARVYAQIAEAVNDPATWHPVAKKCIQIYRDWYVLAQAVPGAVAGNQIFPKGLYLDWVRTGDPLSKQAILDLANNASFSNTPFPSWLPGPGTIREVAYNLETKLFANDLGGGADYTFLLGRLRLYMAQTLAMLNGEVPSGALAPDPLGIGDLYVRPFMIGLGAEALIEYWSRTHDATVLPLLQPVLEMLWRVAYVPTSNLAVGGAMYYTACAVGAGGTGTAPNVAVNDNSDSNPSAPSPVLNMLLAPAYWWVYSQTHELGWKDRGDALFIGCMAACTKTALLYSPPGKAFNQVMKWCGPEVWAWRNG